MWEQPEPFLLQEIPRRPVLQVSQAFGPSPGSKINGMAVNVSKVSNISPGTLIFFVPKDRRVAVIRVCRLLFFSRKKRRVAY